MSTTLRKADGDLFINNETGRAEEVTGPDKVSQELFSLYSTQYDEARDWGTDLDLSKFKFSSPAEFRAIIFARVNEANKRMLLKQSQDRFLDVETESIRSFSKVDVSVDASEGTGFFFVVADVGDPETEVGQALAFSFKPMTSRHVLPPPFPTGLKFFK